MWLLSMVLLSCARRPVPEPPGCPPDRHLAFPEGSEAGKTLAFAGDALLVGAPEEAGGGAAYLLTAGPPIRLGAPGYTTVGRAVSAGDGDRASELVIGGLDTEGNGVAWLLSADDVALGPPALSTGVDGRGLSLTTAPLEEPGLALLVGLPRGSAEGELRIIHPDGRVHHLRGVRAGGFAGGSVATGDLDGDGLLDLAIGAWGEAGSAPMSGAVYLVPGPIENDGSLADATRLPGEAGWDLYGWALAAGDLDQDGRADLLVGAPGADGMELSSGAVYLHPGEATPGVRPPSAILLGPGGDARAGWALVASTPEKAVYIGAPGEAGNQGAVFRVEEPGPGVMMLSQPLVLGQRPGDLAGSSLALGPGDQQGCQPLAIGAPGGASVLLRW